MFCISNPVFNNLPTVYIKKIALKTLNYVENQISFQQY